MKIDPKSIKLNTATNPFHVVGLCTAEVHAKYNGSGTPFDDFDNFKMVSCDGHMEGPLNCSFVGHVSGEDIYKDPEEIKKLFEEKGFSLCSYTITRDVQPIYSLVDPPRYLYKYIPKKVRCSGCRSRFFHTKLESDYIETGIDEDGEEQGYLEENKCPFCKKIDCCVVEFEKPKEDYDL